MSNIDQLKQYVEKELHAKRFLTETLNDLKEVEKYLNKHDELLKLIEREDNNLIKVQQSIVLAEQELENIAVKKQNISAEAEALIDKAKDEVKTILQDARNEADVLVSMATTESDAVKGEIDNLKIDKEALQQEITTLTDERDKIADAVAQVRAKLEV